ncbi:NAD(P)-binding domain-containing protein [Kribbella sp. NPDC026611]|uniref:NAD(P)-dependent oxidoreductase n=1 Tax=Kribbella sp. NPDC026611 TaxID=3154911 RepID=UPI0033E9ABD0
MKSPVTVLGLGAMGTALARALVNAGHPTTVWNRTPGRSPELGVTRATTPEEAAAASPLIVVCLLVADTVRETLAGLDLTDRTIVNLTNTTPEQSRAIADEVSLAGGSYLDGGIMAVPPMIATPAAFIFYSGPQDVFENHQSVLETMARPEYVGADPGFASLHDIALLSAMYGLFAGATHALALTTSAGLPAEPFTTNYLHPWLTAMLGSVPHIAAELDHGPAEPSASSLSMQAAAYDNLVTTATAQGSTRC